LSELPLPQVGDALLVFVRVALPDALSHVPVTGAELAVRHAANNARDTPAKVGMWGVMRNPDEPIPQRDTTELLDDG